MEAGRQASGGWGFIILFALVEVEVVVVVMVGVLGKAGYALQLALRASCSGLSLTRPE